MPLVKASTIVQGSGVVGQETQLAEVFLKDQLIEELALWTEPNESRGTESQRLFTLHGED